MNTTQSLGWHVCPLAMKKDGRIEAKNPVFLKEKINGVLQFFGNDCNLLIAGLSYSGFKPRDKRLRNVGYMRKIRLQNFARLPSKRE